MSAEIELKLLVNREFATFLSKEMASFNVLSHTQQVLGNCYYDSDDYFFSSQRMGLRVRTENERFILTLKTDGKVVGGLHMRPEYNVDLVDAVPRLDGLSAFSDLSLSRPLEQLQAALKPIFSTDFLRQAWIIELGNGANIEVALDQGEIEAGEKLEPICEAEFELKHGSVDDLLTFVEHLSLTDGIRLGAASKAKRGYQLAGVLSLKSFDWQNAWQPFLEQIDQQDSYQQEKRAVLSQLLAYEQKLVEYYAERVNKHPRSAEELNSALQAFFQLYDYYEQHQDLLWLVYQQQIESINLQKIRLDQELLEEFSELNRRLLAKVIELQQNLSMEHSVKTQRLYDLLHRGSGVKRQIALIKLTFS